MVTPTRLQKQPHICPGCGKPMNPPVRSGGPWKCRTDGCPITLGYLSEKAVKSLIRDGLAPKDATCPIYMEATA